LFADKEKVPFVIRHCVFLRFRDDVSSSDRQSIYRDLETLCTRLPGAPAITSGANVSPEVGMDKGYAEGFILDFADAVSRDAYLADPEHQAIAGRIVASTVGGANGVIVFDMEV
jgi:Stress responsive A/B Barrel Domain